MAALVAFLLAACSRPTPVPQTLIAQAVQATLSALPTATSPPTASPAPSPSSMPLGWIFCEYAFCISHPQGLAFYDVIAKQNPNSAQASTVEAGMLAANSSTIFIQLIWQKSTGTGDPAAMLDLVVDDRVDTQSGQQETIAIGGVDAIAVPLMTSATQLLPYGEAGAWACGDRAFGWKAYANKADAPGELLRDAVRSFRCED